MELREDRWKSERKPLPMNPSTSMGWGQERHSVCFQRENKNTQKRRK